MQKMCLKRYLEDKFCLLLLIVIFLMFPTAESEQMLVEFLGPATVLQNLPDLGK